MSSLGFFDCGPCGYNACTAGTTVSLMWVGFAGVPSGDSVNPIFLVNFHYVAGDPSDPTDPDFQSNFPLADSFEFCIACAAQPKKTKIVDSFGSEGDWDLLLQQLDVDGSTVLGPVSPTLNRSDLLFTGLVYWQTANGARVVQIGVTIFASISTGKFYTMLEWTETDSSTGNSATTIPTTDPSFVFVGNLTFYGKTVPMFSPDNTYSASPTVTLLDTF